ncbi:MAG: 3-hydroxyacyl-CoA dehydrogenase family protein [Lachnospiraceae bacterium]|nr:3-hydroxyacyl-CoA dehydrogenase family protein [Lachnospiraceae bacterium]
MKEINKIVIAGAGVMGSSLAQIFAQYGYKTVVFYRNEKSKEKSIELINTNQRGSVNNKILSPDESKQLVSNISFSNNKECFKTADVVIETIAENMEVKHSFWKEISSVVKEEAILTTNTSGLSITEISKAVHMPERFCGFHWVNPPHIVPLVELIRGEKTEEEVINQVYELAKSVGKKPIILQKEAPGFVLNRFQYAILREAMHIVDNGICSISDIDNVFKYGLGMHYAAIGPFETADLGGLDTFLSISEYLFKELADEKEVSNLLKNLVLNGQYGVKSESGFYDYSNGKDVEAIVNRDEKFFEIAKCLYE